MQLEIRLKAQLAHDEASARYAQALDNNYHMATNGRSRSYVQALRIMALALLGSPFCRVTNRKWDDDTRKWLLSLKRG